MPHAGNRQGMKLGLGGHSYIAQLGNDPPASFDDQCTLVAACLDAGIRLLIVAMRKQVWVQANLAALARGPLTSEEAAQLAAWVARVA